MVFQLLADKLRSAGFQAEVCVLCLCLLAPKITCPLPSTALPGFSQIQLPAQQLGRQKWCLLVKGGAAARQSRASRGAGCPLQRGHRPGSRQLSSAEGEEEAQPGGVGCKLFVGKRQGGENKHTHAWDVISWSRGLGGSQGQLLCRFLVGCLSEQDTGLARHHDIWDAVTRVL